MPETKLAKRMTVIADITIKPTLLNEFLKLGAKGYHCVVVFGKGEHEQIGDLLTGSALVRIELVTTPEVADAIMDYVHSGKFHNYALTAYVDNVEVDERDTFF
ncbi:MAG: hypothetical protein HUJ26_19610 [Planctomycetaceae bacterium]|nr:hypothetical protein [Planctomycetaceae bacterium]